MKWLLVIWIILVVLCNIAQYKWDKAMEKHDRKHGIYRMKPKRRRKWNWDCWET